MLTARVASCDGRLQPAQIPAVVEHTIGEREECRRVVELHVPGKRRLTREDHRRAEKQECRGPRRERRARVGARTSPWYEHEPDGREPDDERDRQRRQAGDCRRRARDDDHRREPVREEQDSQAAVYRRRGRPAPPGRGRAPRARRGTMPRRRSTGARDLVVLDERACLTGLGRVDLHLIRDARVADIHACRALRVQDSEPAAGKLERHGALLVRDRLDLGERVGCRVRRDRQELRPAITDLRSAGQIPDEDASFRRLRELVGRVLARAGPVERRASRDSP